MARMLRRKKKNRILEYGHAKVESHSSRLLSFLPVTLVHGIKSLVDIVEAKVVGDKLVNLDLASEVVLNKTGQLRAALDTTKGRSAPDTASHQLEGTGLNLLASSSDTDNDGLTPSLVACLQRQK